MNHFTKMLVVTASLGFAAAAFAQETPAVQSTAPVPPAGETPADPNALAIGQAAGAPADGPGSVYLAATHGAWEQRCVRTADGADPCQLYQLLKDTSGNSVAEVSMFGLPAGQEAVAGATVIAPLETLLTAQLTIQVDTGDAKLYPFTWCSVSGCVARVGFTQADIDAFKKGAKATVTIVPVAAPDQKVALDLSLTGFTAGFTAVAATTPTVAPAGN
nr:invasion associated locus B family protein [Rhodobacter sp. SW2]